MVRYRYVCLAAVLLATAAPLMAQEQSTALKKVETEGRISEVTVFLGSAIVTRAFMLEGTAGEYEVRLGLLPQSADAWSATARVGEAARVVDVQVETREVEQASDAAVQAKRDEILKISADLARLADELIVLHMKSQFLDSLRRTWGSTWAAPDGKQVQAPTVEDAGQALAFMDRYTELLAAKRGIEAEREALTTRKGLVEKELTEVQGTTTLFEHRPVVRVAKFNARPVEVSVTYRVGSAYWCPEYELRAADSNTDKVELGYYAWLKQDTGEDWSDVRLTFSTADPSVGLDTPVLEPLTVVQQPELVVAEALAPTFEPGGRRVTAKTMSEGGGGGGVSLWDDSASLFADLGEEAKEEEKLKQEFEYGTQEAVTHATFACRRPQTVPSSTDERRILITTTELEATPRLKAIPRLSGSVYLTAEMTNSGPLPILEGSAKVYLGGDYLGKMYLAEVPTGAKFTASFGPLRQFNVSRKVITTTSGDAGVFAKRYRTECRLQIRVENLSKDRREIEVWEAMPVSRQKDVTVRLTGGAPKEAGYEDARRAKQDNILVWLVTVEPGEDKSAVVEYGYTVEWDRDQYLYGVLD